MITCHVRERNLEYPVNVDPTRPAGCLRRDPRNNRPRDLRIEPDHTITSTGEIGRIEDSCLDEAQDRPIHLWPLRSMRSNTNFDEPSRPW